MSKIKNYQNITYCIDNPNLEKIKHYSDKWNTSESRVLNTSLKCWFEYVEEKKDKDEK